MRVNPDDGCCQECGGTLDVIGAFYYEDQNNYNSSTTPCAYAKTSFVQSNGNVLNVIRENNSACAGTQYAISTMFDYRPLKRVDTRQGSIAQRYGGYRNHKRECERKGRDKVDRGGALSG